MKTKDIRLFLSHLSDLDYWYLRLQCSMANDARTLVKDFLLTKEQFCERMKIPLSEYNSYMNGGFAYTIMHMAIIKAYFMELSIEKAKLEAKKITDIIAVNNGTLE